MVPVVSFLIAETMLAKQQSPESIRTSSKRQVALLMAVVAVNAGLAFQHWMISGQTRVMVDAHCGKLLLMRIMESRNNNSWKGLG